MVLKCGFPLLVGCGYVLGGERTASLLMFSLIKI
jgi:hypothetical protein